MESESIALPLGDSPKLIWEEYSTICSANQDVKSINLNFLIPQSTVYPRMCAANHFANEYNFPRLFRSIYPIYSRNIGVINLPHTPSHVITIRKFSHTSSHAKLLHMPINIPSKVAFKYFFYYIRRYPSIHSHMMMKAVFTQIRH